MGVQSAVLRVPAVRTALGIPVKAAGAGVKPASMMDSIRYARKFWLQQMEDAKVKARADARRR